MTSLTVVQIQINFDQTLDFVKTGKQPSITEDGQPIAMLFSSKDGTELTRQRDIARLDGYLAKRLKNAPQSVSELSIDEINKLVAELRP